MYHNFTQLQVSFQSDRKSIQLIHLSFFTISWQTLKVLFHLSELYRCCRNILYQCTKLTQLITTFRKTWSLKLVVFDWSLNWQGWVFDNETNAPPSPFFFLRPIRFLCVLTYSLLCEVFDYKDILPRTPLIADGSIAIGPLGAANLTLNQGNTFFQIFTFHKTLFWKHQYLVGCP